MTDTPGMIKNKINKYAFSGGGATAEEHRANGGNPEVDVAFQYLTFFLDDDIELARIEEEYKSGRMLSGELKGITIKLIQEFVKSFQEVRLSLFSLTLTYHTDLIYFALANRESLL